MDAVLAVATIIGGIAAIWFFSDKIASLFGLPSAAEAELAAFIREGQKLRGRSGEDPLPVEDYNEWVARMNIYFRSRNKHGYEVRLGDFSGMTFYDDGSERSKFSNAIDGRLRRLDEFLGEL